MALPSLTVVLVSVSEGLGVVVEDGGGDAGGGGSDHDRGAARVGARPDSATL